MKNVRKISSFLFYVTRFLAVLYLATTLYSIISFITEWGFIEKKGGTHFAICYPFSQTPFLLGENNWPYKLFNFLIPIGLYGLFFLLLSNIFRVFRQPKLFTQHGVNQLRWFYLANIFLPPLTILSATIFDGKVEEGLEWVAVIHFFLGVFAYFLAAIFRQGLQLQKEQDLFI